jgi:hypothetical protein
MQKLVIAGTLLAIGLLSGCGVSGEASNGSTNAVPTTPTTATNGTNELSQDTTSAYVNGHPVGEDSNEYGINPELGTPPTVPAS